MRVLRKVSGNSSEFAFNSLAGPISKFGSGSFFRGKIVSSRVTRCSGKILNDGKVLMETMKNGSH